LIVTNAARFERTWLTIELALRLVGLRHFTYNQHVVVMGGFLVQHAFRLMTFHHRHAFRRKSQGSWLGGAKLRNLGIFVRACAQILSNLLLNLFGLPFSLLLTLSKRHQDFVVMVRSVVVIAGII